MSRGARARLGARPRSRSSRSCSCSSSRRVRISKQRSQVASAQHDVERAPRAERQAGQAQAQLLQTHGRHRADGPRAVPLRAPGRAGLRRRSRRPDAVRHDLHDLAVTPVRVVRAAGDPIRVRVPYARAVATTDSPTERDVEVLTRLLGRVPRAGFEVVVRNGQGDPVVIRNAPLLDDGTPMPTRYWLVDPDLSLRVARLESAGGVRAAEAAVDPDGARLRARALRPRTRCRARTRSRRSAAEWWRRRYRAAGSSACTRTSRITSRGATIPSVGGWRRTCNDTSCRRRHGNELDASARRRRRRARSRRQARNPRSADADHAPGPGRRSRSNVCTPTRSSARSTVLREYRGVMDELGVERVRAIGDERGARRGQPRRALRSDRGDARRPARALARRSRGPPRVPRRDRRSCPSPARTSSSTSAAVRPSSSSAPTSPRDSCSIDIGCVRLTEQFLHSDPPTAEELSQAVSVVRDQLADVGRTLPGTFNAPTLVGTAGTVWTLAAIELGVDAERSDLIDHFVLTRAAAEEVFRTLATEPIEQRTPQPRPGAGPGRRDRRRRDRGRERDAALGLRRAARLRGRHPRRPRPRRGLIGRFDRSG